MTIKELCTKVREAAERALGSADEGGVLDYALVLNHRMLTGPRETLALLGRIEELEKALDAFVSCAVVRAGDYDVSVSGWDTDALNKAWYGARDALFEAAP